MIDLKQEVKNIKKRIEELRRHLDIDLKEKEIKNIDKISSDSKFWDDNVHAKKLMKKREEYKSGIEDWNELNQELKDIESGVELLDEEEDINLSKEIEGKLTQLKKDVEKRELKILFTKEFDSNNAFLSIHPGAGGTESQDWAEMLFRMYTRWTETKGWTAEIVNYLPGEEAGIKDITIFISGNFAYGYLKSEKGVHRLIRISPFDSNKRRHTSFASVDVMPEVDDVEIEIKDDDLRIDTYRASGAGGQHINRTESAIRLTHIPTGIVVTCQSERSQFKNKSMAMKVLKAKLYKYYSEKQKEKMEKFAGEKKDIEWGSQIRSYFFQPYKLVKDHRTDVEVTDADSVIDGNIDIFIEAYLKRKETGEK
ncbi:MAG: peptide chain release factor 2 [Candidatus Firestonebacteria bacterium]